jgi:hypothetical protein
MCSKAPLYVTSHRHNESNRIVLAFASIRSKFTIFDSLRSICMKLRYETNFLRESSNLPSPRFPSPRFVNIREPCLSVADSNPQLLMGLFGEGGTGKSRIVNAICKWFEVRGMSDELLITATTGSAAVKIGGQTLHSAIGLRKDGKAGKVSKKSWICGSIINI